MLEKCTFYRKSSENRFSFSKPFFMAYKCSKWFENDTQYIKLKVFKVKVPLFLRLDQRLNHNSSFLLPPWKTCRKYSAILAKNAKISHCGSAVGLIEKRRPLLLLQLLILPTGCHFRVNLEWFKTSRNGIF